MKLLPILTAFLTLTLSTPAATWTISTIAGTGAQGFNGDGGPAIQAEIDHPFGITRGPDGALYFCEYGGQRIRKITSDGKIHSVAGTGVKGYSGDTGPATRARFNQPHEIRFDRAGDFYVADMQNHVIRKVTTKTGIITTIAGTGEAGYSGDGGLATAAQLNQPHSIQFAPDGSLYICELGNNVIRRVDMTTGIITTFAGTGKAGVTPDGAAIDGTPLNGPRSLDFDKTGNLWLVTREGNQVLRFDAKNATIQIIAGNGQKGFTGNGGPAREASLSGPKGLAIDAEGNVWLADTESHSIRVLMAKTGTIELAAGTGVKGDGPDGNPLRCQLSRPHGLFIDTDGSVFIGDSDNNRIRLLRQK
jgi:streptogramin lyase